jgi:glyoxylase-like metal-dependent hydrolase (beta-lactamase superfamily II)
MVRVLIVALFATSGIAGEARGAGITVEPIAGSVYLLRGTDAGNVVASVGENGIVLVDDMYAGVADQMRAALGNISKNPIRFVINTHLHKDHTGANAAFNKLAFVIAHRNVRTRMVSGQEKRSPEAWPTVAIDSELNLFLNGEEIRILNLPAGHTDGDVVVIFSKSNVVHMGDVFMAPAASFVDGSSGGTILGLIQALEFVLPQISADAKVVPGHGPISSRADIVSVETGISAGKTKEQISAEKPFEKWKTRLAIGVPTDAYVDRFYRELTAK